MKLRLKGIGKIESAEVALDGITVIAGENNTGKSTVGRALFSVFHTFFAPKPKSGRSASGVPGTRLI